MLELNKIYCGDCLDIMRKFPDNSIDLVVTSPPYNIGDSASNSINLKNSKIYPEYNDRMRLEDYFDYIDLRLSEMIRISRYTAFNVQLLAGNKIVYIDILSKYKNNLKDICIWSKQAVAQVNRGVLAKGFEFIFLFGKDNKITFEYNNFPPNNYVPNIQEWKSQIFIKGHHATFPPEIPEYFITYFSKKEDIILDPFVGTGTTTMMAKYLSRKYVGIDISPKCCNIANQRTQSKNFAKLDQWFK